MLILIVKKIQSLIRAEREKLMLIFHEIIGTREA